MKTRNLIALAAATIVVARWEKAFDEKRAGVMLNGAANESPTEPGT
jgi:Na+/H+-dicarboxylate symporter